MSITRKLKTTLSHSPLSELLNFLYTYACYRYIFHFARTGRAELFQRRQTAIILSYARQHSRYFGEDAFKMLKGENKELVIVPGASHCDLYDGGGKNAIPFDRIEAFYRKNLK